MKEKGKGIERRLDTKKSTVNGEKETDKKKGRERTIGKMRSGIFSPCGMKQ